MQEPIFSLPSAHALETPLTAWHGCQWHVHRERPFHFTCILWGVVERVEPPLKQAAGSSNSYEDWRVSAELLHPSQAYFGESQFHSLVNIQLMFQALDSSWIPEI